MAWAREAAERGADDILLTSMDRDGTKNGYDLAHPIPDTKRYVRDHGVEVRM